MAGKVRKSANDTILLRRKGNDKKSVSPKCSNKQDEKRMDESQASFHDAETRTYFETTMYVTLILLLSARTKAQTHSTTNKRRELREHLGSEQVNLVAALAFALTFCCPRQKL